LKSNAGLYLIFAVAVYSLLTTGFAEEQNPGLNRAAAVDWLPSIGLVCCVAGAVGVIWLGLSWLKLVGQITSITGLFGENSTVHTKRRRFFALFGTSKVRHLSRLIGARLGGDADYIARLEKQNKALKIQIQLAQRQKKNTEAIIYGIRDAVVVIDESDRLLMANKAAGELFDFDYRDIQHKPLEQLVAAGGREFVDFLRRSRQRKLRAARREIALNISQDRQLKTFDCIVSCVYDENGRFCSVVAILHDITREKEISQTKSDFVSAVSHELKTPLASITAYSEMLLDGEAQDEKTRKKFYSVIQSQAKRLNRLIEDVLNIARIESGLIKVDKKPVSLAILLEEQLRMIKSYAEENGIEIIGPKSKDMIVFGQVNADSDMLSQVIINLLSNAVKYTRPGGSIKIETEVDEIANVARVSVTDTGLGIAEDEIEHVFDKFYRVDANKAKAKGTGLGLNLVKQIVEKVHNGRVFVKSQVGVGSTFGFELPLATSKAVEKMIVDGR
jgi:two-component system phosphate regulon sensor histidine kinase PhoR